MSKKSMIYIILGIFFFVGCAPEPKINIFNNNPRPLTVTEQDVNALDEATKQEILAEPSPMPRKGEIKYFDLNGKYLPGAKDLQEGYVYVPEAGDAGYFAGKWYKITGGKTDKNYTTQTPDVVQKRIDTRTILSRQQPPATPIGTPR